VTRAAGILSPFEVSFRAQREIYAFSAEQIRRCLASLGMTLTESYPTGNSEFNWQLAADDWC